MYQELVDNKIKALNIFKNKQRNRITKTITLIDILFLSIIMIDLFLFLQNKEFKSNGRPISFRNS